MYAKGMTTGDIEAHLKELYDLDISDSTISRITDKIMPLQALFIYNAFSTKNTHPVHYQKQPKCNLAYPLLF